MRPPRRSRKQLKQYTPNSPPEGLNQVNEAPTFRDERETRACDTFRLTLRPNGWGSFGRGTKENWSFIPASLLKKYSASKVFHDGTEGVHYASGWGGLAELLERYGEEYAPTNLVAPARVSDDTSRPVNRQSRTSVKSEDDDETMTDDYQTEPSENGGNRGRGRSDQQDAEDDEEEWVDEESESTAQIKQEGDDNDDTNSTNPAIPNNRALLTTLECLKLCRQEISWLNENPDYFRPRDTNICQDHMRETIINLYSQVSAYNDANASDSEE